MIRTVLRLLPDGSGPRITTWFLLAVVGVLVRAVGVVVLVPLVQALFTGAHGRAWLWAGVLVAITVVGWIVDTITAKRGFAMGFDMADTGQRRVADRITRIRLSWFTAQNTADARQAIAATGPDLVRLIANLATPLLGSVLLPIAIALALLPISVPLGLAALVGVPLLLGAYWASGRLSRAADESVTRANGVLTERVLEFARTQQALRASRRVEPARSHAGAALAAQHGATMRLLLLQLPGQVLFGLASQLALLILAGATVIVTVRGSVSVPEAIALIVVIVRYLEPFTALAELSAAVETTAALLRRIGAVLNAPADTADVRNDADGEAAAGGRDDDGRHGLGGPPTIELRDVTFAYPGSQDVTADRPGATSAAVLAGFSLTLEPGTTTAIVGPSGSGKSTILQLLAGLQEPTSGRVLVDGVDTAGLEADTRQGLVSMVFQEPYLFDDSVRANVLVGNSAAPEDAVDRAARLARVDTLVERLPHGWDTRAGEAGGTLSGGERQRVSIARALLKPAPLLLVDEATSALDTENGAAVTAALSDDPVARTRVIVAHQLSSIRAADRVVFLERGHIVEDGTVDELLAAGGRFARFWQHQDAAASWHLRG